MSWNKEQEQYLVDNYGKKTTAEIATDLRKPLTNVYSKAGRLGLKYVKQSEREALQEERKAKMNETKKLIDNTLQRLGV